MFPSSQSCAITPPRSVAVGGRERMWVALRFRRCGNRCHESHQFADEIAVLRPLFVAVLEKSYVILDILLLLSKYGGAFAPHFNMLDFLPFFFFSVILSLTQLFFLFLVLSTPMSSNLPPVTSFQRWQPVPATQPQPSAAILSGHTPPSLSLFLFFISPAPSLFLSRGFSIFFCLFLFFLLFFFPSGLLPLLFSTSLPVWCLFAHYFELL